MKKVDFKKYLSKARVDVGYVNGIISKGAYLSDDEWFDFNVKSALVGYKSSNAKKYRAFSKEYCKLSKVYSEVMKYLVQIIDYGFTNKTFLKNVRRFVSSMNRLMNKEKVVRISGFDKNGVFRIVASSSDSNIYHIKGKSDAVMCIESVIGYCIEKMDFLTNNSDFTKFLKGYINEEFVKILSGVKPAPYVGDISSRKLSMYISDSNNSTSLIEGVKKSN